MISIDQIQDVDAETIESIVSDIHAMTTAEVDAARTRFEDMTADMVGSTYDEQMAMAWMYVIEQYDDGAYDYEGTFADEAAYMQHVVGSKIPAGTLSHDEWPSEDDVDYISEQLDGAHASILSECIRRAKSWEDLARIYGEYDHFHTIDVADGVQVFLNAAS